MLDRAEGLQKQFFTLDQVGQAPLWRPPVDLFETAQGILIRAAIPDAEVDSFQVSVQDKCLQLSGTRPFPSAAQPLRVHRLEIPFGRIERVIPLPSGRFVLKSVSYKAGCLEILLTREMP